MDAILQTQAAKVLADLAEHGGGTYEGRTLLPFTPTQGYAVGIGGFALPAGVVNTETAAWALKAVAGEWLTTYAGTWLKDDLVYFDAVRYFALGSGVQAEACGRFYGQQAIHDFGTGKDITL